MQRRQLSSDEIKLRQVRVTLKNDLATLLDYLDTLDRKTWDELNLYKLYNTSLETFEGLYKHYNIEDVNKE